MSTTGNVWIWLDDHVPPASPEYTFWVKTEEEFKMVFDCFVVDVVSFDHDLGDGEPNGYELAKWLGEQVLFFGTKMPEWNVHSQNPVGRDNIIFYLQGVERELKFRC